MKRKMATPEPEVEDMKKMKRHGKRASKRRGRKAGRY